MDTASDIGQRIAGQETAGNKQLSEATKCQDWLLTLPTLRHFWLQEVPVDRELPMQSVLRFYYPAIRQHLATQISHY